MTEVCSPAEKVGQPLTSQRALLLSGLWRYTRERRHCPRGRWRGCPGRFFCLYSQAFFPAPDLVTLPALCHAEEQGLSS